MLPNTNDPPMELTSWQASAPSNSLNATDTIPSGCLYALGTERLLYYNSIKSLHHRLHISLLFQTSHIPRLHLLGCH